MPNGVRDWTESGRSGVPRIDRGSEGRVRGLLCPRCKVGVSTFQGDVERAGAAIASEDFLLISALGIAGLLWTTLYWPRMAIRFEKIWVQQCRATEGIKRRFGAKSALDYLIREKLLNFVEQAEWRPEFARELPLILSEVSVAIQTASNVPQIWSVCGKQIAAYFGWPFQ